MTQCFRCQKIARASESNALGLISPHYVTKGWLPLTSAQAIQDLTMNARKDKSTYVKIIESSNPIPTQSPQNVTVVNVRNFSKLPIIIRYQISPYVK